MFSAARGLAARADLPGYAEATWSDLANAVLWQIGGPLLLAWGNALAVFFGWTVGTLAVLLAALFVAEFLRLGRTRGLAVGCAVLGILIACIAPVRAIFSRPEKLSSLRVLAPLELTGEVKALDGSEVFATASGQAFLLLFAPGAAGGVSPEQAAALSLDVPAWREALRAARWQAVLLTGPVQEYRPLLDHLVVAPDWHLATLTNQGFLFRRGPGRPAPSLDVETFRLSTNEETGLYLAQIAERYDAIRRTAEARNSMERALELAPKNAAVLAHAANLAASHGRWQDAIALSQKALVHDPDFTQAKIVQALAYMEIGQSAPARHLVEQVLARHPEDLYTLFLAARINKMRNDNTREAETLERLIALSQSKGLPVLNYQIYLGQAYARLGQADAALKNYRAVLASGQLKAEQAAEIETAIATIESRTRPGR